MDTRKVLEMGGGTVLISLPKGWAQRNGIAKGTSVLVEEMGPRRLMVTPMSGKEEQAKTVLIEYPNESQAHLVNDVTGAYLIGSDSIKIQGKQMISREDRERMKTLIRRLVGLEIMDEDSKSMTLQFLPEPSALDPEKIVRRMSSLTQGMIRDTGEALANADEKMLSLIVERDDEVDRLYFLLVRAIRTATIDPALAERYDLTPVECLDYRVLATALESLGDTVSEFARMTKDLPELAKMNEAREAFELLERMEDVSIRMFLSRKSRRSRRDYLEVETMERKVNELSRRIAQPTGLSTRTTVDFLSMLERIAKTFVDISDLALPTYVFEDDTLHRRRSKA
ncbi:MAG: phosphate uptake regulator PhoU [Thaumarchaeota archaeon]|nr:phosphate uptake regulator PhoU [Nitrososphaerota archaeon]